MAKLNLGYSEGMNKDLGFDKRSPNQYYDAMNIDIVNNGSNLCITNTRGKYIIDNPISSIYDQTSEVKIVGQSNIRDGAVLFIRKIKEDNSQECYLLVLYENENKEIIAQNDLLQLNLSGITLGDYIDSVSIVENNKDKIYFVDGKNQVRLIVLNKDINNDFYIEEISLSNPRDFFVDPNEYLDVQTEAIQGDSSLGYGEYQYFIIGLTKNGVTTNPSFLSKKIIINKEMINKYFIQISLFIRNLGSNIEKINLYRIKYLNEDISIQLILEQNLSSLDNIILNDDGRSFLQEISLEEFNSLFKNILIPKTIDSIYNRLIVGNIDTYSNFEFLKDFDTRAYSYIFNYTVNDVSDKSLNADNLSENGIYYNLSKDDISIEINKDVPYNDPSNNYDSVPKDSNCILDLDGKELFLQVYNGDDGYKYLGAAGKNIIMTVDSGSQIDTECTFVSGETYRFGIIFYDKYMNRSPVKWICDYTFPEYNSLLINSPSNLYNSQQRPFDYLLYKVNFKLTGIKEQLDILNKNEIEYFDICYVKRDQQNSKIVDFAICVPGFENKNVNLKSTIEPGVSDYVLEGSSGLNCSATVNYIIDKDFEDPQISVSDTAICLPYQIMKDIVFVGLEDPKIRSVSGNTMTIYNTNFCCRGGRLSVDNDYGFDWDQCNIREWGDPGVIINYKKPTKQPYSYLYSPSISTGKITDFYSLRPILLLINNTNTTRYPNKTHINGAPYKGIDGNYTDLTAGSIGASNVSGVNGYLYPFRNGYGDNYTVPKNDNEVIGFNYKTLANSYVTSTLFCPASNATNKFNQTLYIDNIVQNYGYKSSFFVRQYYGVYNQSNLKMYRTNYKQPDPYLIKPDFIQYENDGEYIIYDGKRISNAGKLADFYIVPWTKTISSNLPDTCQIQYMQLDCHYANTIATSFNYNFNDCKTWLSKKDSSVQSEIKDRTRYQILFQLRNDLKNQYGGNTYLNKVNNRYIICSNKPSRIDLLEIAKCTGDMSYGTFTIPRVWCNNDGGQDLPITNTNAGILRHNEFVTLVDVPMRISDYDRGDLFATTKKLFESAEDSINRDYNNFCLSSIKYDDKEVLNISSSIYNQYNIREYVSSNFENLMFNYPTKLNASNVKIYGENIDNWMIFPVNETLSLDQIYGDLTRIINHNGKLFGFQKNGVAFISVQPRVMINTTDSIDIQLGTGQYFDRFEMVSTNSGASNIYAISGGFDNLYYIDSNKNALFNLMRGNEELSLTKGLYTYFNNNVNDNAKCFYDSTSRKLYVYIKYENGIDCVVFSELLGTFESRYSERFDNLFTINDHFIGYENNVNQNKSFVNEIKYPYNKDSFSENPYIEFLVNPNNNNYIRYDVVEYTQQDLDNHINSNVNLFNIRNYYQNATSSLDDNSLDIKNKFNIFRINVPRDKNIDSYNKKGLRRIISPQAFIKLQFDGTKHITSNLNLNFY